MSKSEIELFCVLFALVIAFLVGGYIGERGAHIDAIAHVPITDNALWMLYGDGSCYYATADRISGECAHSAPHPAWATHIIYFSK